MKWSCFSTWSSCCHIDDDITCIHDSNQNSFLSIWGTLIPGFDWCFNFYFRSSHYEHSWCMCPGNEWDQQLVLAPTIFSFFFLFFSKTMSTRTCVCWSWCHETRLATLVGWFANRRERRWACFSTHQLAVRTDPTHFPPPPSSLTRPSKTPTTNTSTLTRQVPK